MRLFWAGDMRLSGTLGALTEDEAQIMMNTSNFLYIMIRACRSMLYVPDCMRSRAHLFDQQILWPMRNSK